MNDACPRWVGRWIDLYPQGCDHDMNHILAANAEALELDVPGVMPEAALMLFRVDLEGTAADPRWANRRIESALGHMFKGSANWRS